MKRLTKLKTATQIKKERAYYYVECNSTVVFESESLAECKNYMAQYIKDHKEEVMEEPYNYNICMYNIIVDD